MREITDASFEQDVLQSKRPVVVDFWAPWCGPCRAVAPVFEQLAAEHAASVDFVKLDIDENFVTAGRYGILSIPTAVLFADGEPRSAVVGAYGRGHYERAWADWLA